MVDLREAQAADVPAIQDVVRQAHSPYIARMGQPPGPMLDDYEQLVRDGFVPVVEQSEEVVGLLVLIPGADHLLLDNVALHPGTQGQGIGRLMLEEAERVARLQGCANIRLYTNELMTENIRLYEHIGYVETHKVEENGFRRIYMAKELA